jgi:hypothetical protein
MRRDRERRRQYLSDAVIPGRVFVPIRIAQSSLQYLNPSDINNRLSFVLVFEDRLVGLERNLVFKRDILGHGAISAGAANRRSLG